MSAAIVGRGLRDFVTTRSASIGRAVRSYASSRWTRTTVSAAEATPCCPMALHLRNRGMSLRDIRKRLVITTGAKKGQSPSPGLY